MFSTFFKIAGSVFSREQIQRPKPDLSSCEPHPAHSVDDIKAAYALVHDQYVPINYMPKRSCGMRFSLFELLPTAHTFITRDKHSNLISTATLHTDRCGVLPMDDDFKEEAAAMRDKGLKIAQGGMFASDKNIKNNNRFVACKALMSQIIAFCLDSNIDSLCLIVHPKHVDFWQRIVGFEKISEKESCKHIKGQPAVLLALNLRDVLNDGAKVTAFTRSLLKQRAERSKAGAAYHLEEGQVLDFIFTEPSVWENRTEVENRAFSSIFPRMARTLDLSDFFFKQVKFR